MALWQQEEGEEMRDLCFGLSIVDIAGPVLMSCSSDAQKSRYLPTMLSGEEFWCMLFSEPHGGSDVAALRTRAVKDGDEWIVNGQKVWTSNAHHADFGLLIARTDSTVPKHKGLTYFILDMHAPGVVIRPLKQITGNSEFCEVFFDDVRIPDSNRMGELGGGWKIIMATLANEKAALRSFQIHLKKFLHAIEELDIDGLAAIEHPLVQEKIKQINNKYWAVRFIEFQNLHNAVNKEQPGHEEVISKLLVASTNLDLAGFVIDLYNSKCFENDTRKSATLKFFEYVYFHFIGVSMGGGTEEILLNLIESYWRLSGLACRASSRQRHPLQPITGPHTHLESQQLPDHADGSLPVGRRGLVCVDAEFLIVGEQCVPLHASLAEQGFEARCGNISG